jgi:hypothetical protein
MAGGDEFFYQSGVPNATEDELGGGGGINTVILGQFDLTSYHKYYNFDTEEHDQDGPSENRKPQVDIAVRTGVPYFEAVVGGVFFMTNSSGVIGSKVNIGAYDDFYRYYDVTSEVAWLRVLFSNTDYGDDYSVLPTTAHIHAVAWFGAQRQDGSVTDPRIEDFDEWY